MDDNSNSQNLTNSDSNTIAAVNQPVQNGDAQQTSSWVQSQSPQTPQPAYVVPPDNSQQPVTASPSPEVPARIEGGGERLTAPETIQVPERREQQPQVQKEAQTKSVVEAPQDLPDQAKFESPFNVYGYKVSSQISSVGKGKKKVQGDTNSAKTWLVVFLNRLLKIYEQGGEAVKQLKN